MTRLASWPDIFAHVATLQLSQRVGTTVATMRAQRLELLNFKSYKGAQTVGPFIHNFTAIIGPNGSGM